MSKSTPHTFTAKVWMYPGPASWYFAGLPKQLSITLRNAMKGRLRGFGSIRVRTTIGETTWDTSIFPDSRSGTYLLPIKSTVRKLEGIDDGDEVTISLSVRK